MKLSPDQKKALETILKWFKDENKNQFITLGGYAGTGKTTLIAFLRKELQKKKYRIKKEKKLKVAFVSYTGKAARVLENNLKQFNSIFPKDSVSTIHSLIYSPIEDTRGEIVGWELKDNVSNDLIIVDEASMVNGNIWKDLLSYEIPIIAVGDHGQLPPIRGKFNLMKKPNIRLEKIHRQARDNPIIKVSKLAREKGSIPVKKYSSYVKKIDRSDNLAREEVEDLLTRFDEETLIICGYNHTRVNLNNYVREKKGFYTPIPKSGDRVICLRNNHKKQIFNGMLGFIESIIREDNNWYHADIEFDDAHSFSGLISAEQFGRKTPMNFTKDRKKTLKGDLFDFGYAITVHKAQGSQARKVILFEERFKQMDEAMWRRWLYTGVTRAEEELYIVGS